MDILDNMGVSKLSAKVFLKVNYSFNALVNAFTKMSLQWAIYIFTAFINLCSCKLINIFMLVHSALTNVNTTFELKRTVVNDKTDDTSPKINKCCIFFLLFHYLTNEMYQHFLLEQQ